MFEKLAEPSDRQRTECVAVNWSGNAFLLYWRCAVWPVGVGLAARPGSLPRRYIVPGYLYLSVLEHDPGSDESATKPGNDSVADNRGSRGGGDRHSCLAVLSVPATVEVASTIAPTTTAPDWVLKLEEILAPIEAPVTLLYTVLDVALLIAAATLLLAFWGGRFSQSWQMIAAAAFSLYIADMGFKYALDKVANYESGGLIEVFWIFSPVLFGIGAALEYDLSTRTTRRSRRRS